MYGDRPVAYRGLAEAPGEPRPLSAEQVSPELFEILGVPPVLGTRLPSRGGDPRAGTRW